MFPSASTSSLNLFSPICDKGDSVNGVPLACAKCFSFLFIMASSSFSLVSIILVLSMVVVFPDFGLTCWVMDPTSTWVRGLSSLGLIVPRTFR